MRQITLLTFFGLLAACAGKTAGTCTNTSDCSGGQFCSAGKCGTPQCLANSDCGADKVCTDNVCKSGASGAGLHITQVDGDSPVLDDKDGSALHRIASALVISGTGFSAGIKSVQFATATQVFDLAFVASADAATLTATLPAALAAAVPSDSVALAGRVIVSSADTTLGADASGTISILRGEAGAPGNGGTATMCANTGMQVSTVNGAAQIACAPDANEQLLVTATAGTAFVATTTTALQGAPAAVISNSGAGPVLAINALGAPASGQASPALNISTGLTAPALKTTGTVSFASAQDADPTPPGTGSYQTLLVTNSAPGGRALSVAGGGSLAAAWIDGGTVVSATAPAAALNVVGKVVLNAPAVDSLFTTKVLSTTAGAAGEVLCTCDAGSSLVSGACSFNAYSAGETMYHNCLSADTGACVTSLGTTGIHANNAAGTGYWDCRYTGGTSTTIAICSITCIKND